MIRIEDTDQARSSEESARGILEDLAWLGLEWDDGPTLTVGGRVIGGSSRPVGPYFQAQRMKLYNEQVDRLARMGRAYPAFETSEELEARRKSAVAAKQTYRYERPADVVPGQYAADRWARAARGETHVVRFVAPNEEIIVRDEILGDVRIAAGELDDLVIRKADGFPTYHFAVVVDDELMGVTHVLRAQEHLANTPRHVAMQKALGFRTPVYGHMPLICNMDGSKMSKRDKAKAARKAAKDSLAKDKTLTPQSIATSAEIDAALLNQFLAAENDSLDVAERLAALYKIALPEIEVDDFRRAGYLPEALINFLALLGWNPGMKSADGKDLEKFDLRFISQHFSLERINKGAAKFDRVKLLSFNADCIAAMPDEEFLRRWLDWMAQYEPSLRAKVMPDESPESRARAMLLVHAVKPRAKTLRDAVRPIGFALVGDAEYTFDQAAAEKQLLANNRAGLALLREFTPRLEGLADWTPAAITSQIEAFAREKGMPNPGGIAQPLRVAVTGTGVSPGLGETLAVLGKNSTLVRVHRCVRQFSA
jgi:glutamyl-tRNA synthetase